MTRRAKADREPEEEETRKNPAAVALGRRGGRATAASMTPAERSASAGRASRARWAATKKATKKGAK